MNCARTRTAISAGLDGEALGVAAGELAAHLEACAACAAWRERVHRLTRLVRLQAAPPLAMPVGLLDAVGEAAPPRRRWLVPVTVPATSKRLVPAVAGGLQAVALLVVTAAAVLAGGGVRLACGLGALLLVASWLLLVAWRAPRCSRRRAGGGAPR